MPGHHVHGGDDGGAHGHDHPGVPGIARLLFLAALSLLPATSPAPMTLADFTRRVQQDRKQAIKGCSVRLAGFDTPDKQGDSWYLTRLVLNCSAVYAQSVKGRIPGAPALPANAYTAALPLSPS